MPFSDGLSHNRVSARGRRRAGSSPRGGNRFRHDRPASRRRRPRGPLAAEHWTVRGRGLPRLRDGIRRKLSLVLHRQELLTEDWVSEEYRINNSPGAVDALGEIARYFAEAIDDDVLSEDEQRTLLGAVPTLLVWGDADEVVPLSVVGEVERSLRTSVVRIAAAGHVPYYENPADFNDCVLGFLASPAEAAQ
jgi:pimeloyl-ACP methyl ester carboxylesterase